MAELPDIVIEDEDVWWAMEEIRGFKVEVREDGFVQLEFLVKWTGMDESSWEPYESFNDMTRILAREFLNRHILYAYPP